MHYYLNQNFTFEKVNNIGQPPTEKLVKCCLSSEKYICLSYGQVSLKAGTTTNFVKTTNSHKNLDLAAIKRTQEKVELLI